MKRILIAVFGVVILVVVAAPFVVPRVIDWNSFKPEIAEAVREATGRDLVIGGDIEVSLLPSLEFSISDIRISNAPGMTAPAMVTVGSVTGKIGVWPLLSSELVVDSLVVSKPSIFLEVNRKGLPNWILETAPAEEGGEFPLSDVRLGEVRIEKGLVSYIDATTGQSLKAEELNVTVALPNLASALAVKVGLKLNGDPVSLDLAIDTPRKVLSGERFKVVTSLDSKRVTVGLDGTVQQRPLPGFDGTFDLDIGSVGALAAWLGQPLDSSQPDPGPLKVHAVLAAEGAKVALKEATIEGEGMKAEADGSFDGSGEVAKISLNVKSGVLDIDRYLPPPAAAKARPGRPAEDKGEGADVLAGLSDQALDLSPLRQTEAQVRVDIGGVKVAGFEVGRVTFSADLKGGVLKADLSELALYGGNVTGVVELDGAGDALGVAADLRLEGIAVDQLARVATAGDLPVTGVASGALNVAAKGASPRALAQNLSGKFRFDLGGVDVKDAPVGAVSEVKIALDLPGLERAPSLKAEAVYNKRRLNVDLTLDPLNKILAGERFAVKAALASSLISVRYDGSVQQRPVPGLDGDFDLDIGSVGKLAAWLDQPLDPNQPDPGPLKIRASFAAEGAKVVLKQAIIEGTALNANANGSFDGGGPVAKIVLNLQSKVLDIDRYLPPPAAGEAGAAKEPAQPGGAPIDVLALLSSDPIDLGPLRGIEADIRVGIGGVKAVGFEIGAVTMNVALKGGVLEASLAELHLYDGNVTGAVKLDGTGKELDFKATVALAGIAVDKLARAATGDEPPLVGVASGSLEAAARGASPRALAESLKAKVAFKLGGVEMKDAGAGAITELKFVLDLPGLESAPSLTGAVVYNEERLAIDVTLDPLKKILAGERFAVRTALESALIKARYDGSVQQQPVPGLDGVFDLDIGSVGKLAAWLGQPLDPAQPDPGALKARAEFAADGAKVVLKKATLEGEALKVEADGSFDGSGDVAKVVLNLTSGVLDIDRYLPPAAEKSAEDGPAKPSGETTDALAALSDEAIDLSALRGIDADIRVGIGGVKAAGFEIGAVALGAVLKGGVLEAKLEKLGLYDGSVTGEIRIDGAGKALDFNAKLVLAGIAVDKLARAATGGEPPVVGIASGSLEAAARGASPKALAESMRAKIAFNLGGVEIKDAPQGALTELAVKLDLPGLKGAPSLRGTALYNKQRLEIDVTTAPLKTILSGKRFAVKAAVASPLLKVGLNGRVRQRPVPGFDGAFDLGVPSVGKLAAWLGQPLDPAQPDPGPLNIHASLATDGAKVLLKQATIKGKALDVKAKGSFDGGGEVARVVLNLTSGVIDIDRYLPPPAKVGTTAEKPAQEQNAQPADMLAALPDDKIDLAALRGIDADIRVGIGGVKAAGFEIGKVALVVVLKGGVLQADLKQLGLYGGNVKGSVKIGGAGEALSVDAKVKLAGISVAKLARAATGAEPPVSGKLSASLSATARGASPRALAESFKAKIGIRLPRVNVREAKLKPITKVRLDLDVPGLASPPSVKASAVYNKRPVKLEVTLEPLKKILAGERFAVKVALASKLVSAGYEGSVQQRPVPGLDGAFDLDIGSVGKLAAWLDQPLDKKQPDPGPLKVHASFASDGAKVALKQASITGKALKVGAEASFDGGGAVPNLIAKLKIEHADLNAYLPPREKEAKAAEAPKEEAPGTAAKGWSEEPLDLAAMRQMNADIRIDIGRVLYRELVIESGVVTVLLSGGILKAKVQELKVADGIVTADVSLDGSGKFAALGYQASVTGVQAKPLLTALADFDQLSGKMEVRASGKARGRSEREIVETLNGDGSLKFLDGAIEGINLAATLRKAKTLGMGSGGGEHQKTDFAELGGTFVITNGILDNRDFKMLAPLVRVSGAGVVPMPPRTIDYRVEAKLVATTKGQGGDDALAGLPIPINVTGTWDNPSYNVDWASVFQQAALDPARLKNMPADLRESAKGFGVDLPGAGLLGGILGSLPGLGKTEEAAPAPEGTTQEGTSGGIFGRLKDAITKGAESPSESPSESTVEPAAEPVTEAAPEAESQQEPASTSPIEKLKGLFGG